MLDNSLIYEKSLIKENISDIEYFIKGENIKYSLEELINFSNERFIRNAVKLNILKLKTKAMQFIL